MERKDYVEAQNRLACFALAVSDIMILNIWAAQVF